MYFCGGRRQNRILFCVSEHDRRSNLMVRVSVRVRVRVRVRVKVRVRVRVRV